MVNYSFCFISYFSRLYPVCMKNYVSILLLWLSVDFSLGNANTVCCDDFRFHHTPLICFHYILSTHCKMWIRRKLLRILIYHQYIYSHCISDLPVIIILPFFVLWQKWQTSHWKHDNDIKTLISISCEYVNRQICNTSKHRNALSWKTIYNHLYTIEIMFVRVNLGKTSNRDLN